MKTCPHCGSPMDGEARFCRLCGGAAADLPRTAPQPPAPRRPKAWIALTAVIAMVSLVTVYFGAVRPAQTQPMTAPPTQTQPPSAPGDIGGADPQPSPAASTPAQQQTSDPAAPEAVTLCSKIIQLDAYQTLSRWIDLIYDVEGGTLQQRFYEGDGDPLFTEIWSFDGDGRPVEYRRHSDDGTLEHKTIRTYRADGAPLTEQRYGEGGVLEGREEWHYDAGGYLSVLHQYDDGSSEPARKWVYTCDAEGKPLVEKCYDGDGSLETWYENTYTARGDLLSQVRHRADGSVEWRRESTYDADGRILSERNQQGTSVSLIEYVYDTQGNLLSEKELDPSGFVWTWLEYSYDEHGNESTMWDNTGGLSRWYYESTYDDDGNHLRTVTYAGKTTYDGESQFTYQTLMVPPSRMAVVEAMMDPGPMPSLGGDKER